MKVKIIYILVIVLIPEILFAQNIDIKALRAYSDIEKGEYFNAIEKLDNLIYENPKSEYYLAKVEIFYKQNKYNEAITYCETLNKIKPNYGSAFKLRILLELGDRNKVKLALEENLKSNYKISLFDLLETEDYSLIYQMELDKYVISSNLFSRTEKQLYQVERLIQINDYDQALFILNEMLLQNKNIAQGYYLQSKIKYFEKDIDGALNSINKAINLKSANTDYLLQRVFIAKDLKEYSMALQDIKKIIRMNPYQIENYIVKVDLLYKTNQLDEAIRLTNSILEILPNNPDLLYLSGKSYYSNSNYFEALKAVNQSLEIKQDKNYFELRGDIYLATNSFEFAVKDYSMFLDIEAYNGDIYSKKGFARYKFGDKKGACSDWEKGKRYGSYEAIQYLEKYCK
jgi:tetratricopeptide (TPR) repeat protein